MPSVGGVSPGARVSVVGSTDIDAGSRPGYPMEFSKKVGHVLNMLNDMPGMDLIEAARVERIGVNIEVVGDVDPLNIDTIQSQSTGHFPATASDVQQAFIIDHVLHKCPSSGSHDKPLLACRGLLNRYEKPTMTSEFEFIVATPASLICVGELEKVMGHFHDIQPPGSKFAHARLLCKGNLGLNSRRLADYIPFQLEKPEDLLYSFPLSTE